MITRVALYRLINFNFENSGPQKEHQQNISIASKFGMGWHKELFLKAIVSYCIRFESYSRERVECLSQTTKKMAATFIDVERGFNLNFFFLGGICCQPLELTALPKVLIRERIFK